MSRPTVVLVKFGGALLEDETLRARALDAFASLRGHRVLVHGGGAAASALAERLGVESRMVDGRRVTSREMLDVVTMVYGGSIGRGLAAALQARGCDAVSLTGADFGLVRADRRSAAGGTDYGYVGDVREVRGGMLARLLDSGAVPVIAPLTYDGAGGLLNTNADTIAAAVASALASEMDVTLCYCFDRAGVTGEDGRVLPELTPGMAHDLLRRAVISAGMMPKAQNAFDALRAGTRRVLIIGLEGLELLNADAPHGGTEVRL